MGLDVGGGKRFPRFQREAGFCNPRTIDPLQAVQNGQIEIKGSPARTSSHYATRQEERQCDLPHEFVVA